MKLSKMLFYLVQTLFHVLFVTLMLNAIFSTETLQFSYNIIRDTVGIIAFFTVIGVSIYQVVEGTKKELMLLKNGASFVLGLVEILYVVTYIDVISYASLVIIFFSLVFSVVLTAAYVEHNEFEQKDKPKKKRSKRNQKDESESKLTVYLKNLMRVGTFFVMLQAMFIAYLYVIFAFFG